MVLYGLNEYSAEFCGHVVIEHVALFRVDVAAHQLAVVHCKVGYKHLQAPALIIGIN